MVRYKERRFRSWKFTKAMNKALLGKWWVKYMTGGYALWVKTVVALHTGAYKWESLRSRSDPLINIRNIEKKTHTTKVKTLIHNLLDFSNKHELTKSKGEILQAVMTIVVWLLWKERNDIVFNNNNKPFVASKIVGDIKTILFL